MIQLPKTAIATPVAVALATTSGGAGTSLIGTVTHVRDRNTFEMRMADGYVAIRLSGVHSPEYDERGGVPAAAALHTLAFGKTAICDWTPGDVTHDRLAASCSVDGYDLGGSLIASGVATRCTRYDRPGRYSTLARQTPWPGSIPAYCNR